MDALPARRSAGVESVARSAGLSGPQVLAARLYDGTASIELRWPGRSEIPGLHVGAHIEAEGTVGKQGGAAVIINPLYRVISMEA